MANASTQELTTWATQVLQKRLENVRGVGSVSVVGGLQRQVQLRLRPQAMESLGVTVDQVLAAVKSENQELPLGSIRSADQERVVQINARLKKPEDFRDIVVARKAGNSVKLWQVADVVDGPQEVESLALYNGQRTVLLSVQKSQGENTIEVVDGLMRALKEAAPITPKGIKTEVNRDNSRAIRVSVANVQRTLFEGAALTVLIVFLFLNSWRSTVITGLTLPIALIGTFLFMYLFGFTINNITMMALSLCVGLLIDDAIVVRENIVRHVAMGASPKQAALDGTAEIGLAVLATTLSIVAVFLPIGFMGGIVGKFFHEFGITIVAAVLISMFVSFTLDPMLSSVWHDPQAHGVHRGPPVTLYDKTLGRITLKFDDFTEWLSEAYQKILSWSLAHKGATLGIALSTFLFSFVLLGGVGKEFVPKADLSETQINFYTPVGSSLEVTEARAKQIDLLLRELPEVRYTVTTINSGFAARQDVWRDLCSPGGPQGPPALGRRSGSAHPRKARHRARHHRHQYWSNRSGRGQELAVFHPGHGFGRAGAFVQAGAGRVDQDPWLGGLGHHAQAQQADRLHRGQARCRCRCGSERQCAGGILAHLVCRHHGGQLARAGRREL